jgi:membrane-bound lytic murein transglycosylase A
MIAQDTGSAIVGPARADIFFGAGDGAGRIAGRIRQMGRFAMLIPREIDPAAAAARMPLPRARPVLPAEPVPLPRPRPKIETEHAAEAGPHVQPQGAGTPAGKRAPALRRGRL